MKQKRTELRVPQALKEQLEKAASEQGRSLNNYINFILQQHINGGK